MPSTALVECQLLDPRPATDAAARPIAAAVNIPFAELPDRLHELPPRGLTVRVVGPAPLAREAAAWLATGGRRTVVETDFDYLPADAPRPLGRLWRPNAFLAEILPHLPPGQALDLACGTGRDAVYAAAQGWRVLGIDVLPDALDRAQALAARLAPALAPITWKQLDLERAPLPALGPFDLIIGLRYLHRPLFARFPAWLRPGGSIVYETFTATHRARHGRPTNNAHILQPSELPKLLPGFEVRHHSEDWRADSHTARIWAIRP